MERKNKTTESQGVLLVWRNLGENDAQKYELFKSVSVLCRKYTNKQIGVSKGSLNNYISQYESSNGSDAIVYENSVVRIIKTKLNGIEDYPPTEEEKKENKEKVLKRKSKEG